MRRIDAIAITFGVFLGGGAIYLVLQGTGLDGISAGIWTQLLLVVGLVVWGSSYLLRVVSKKMTYNQQLEDYKEAVLQKRLEEMSPEELAQLQAEIEQEEQST